MKAKVYKTICLIVALMVAVFTVGYAFAWFLDRRDSKFVLSGASAGAYFDSGNGSKETPFVIANSTHMRNLAVLQNMGRFVDENGNPKIYYFEIKKTIDELDMGDGLWLPPIGNDEAPFIGVFNGNGKSIKNLKVTTDKTLLKEENYPIEASPTYKFSNAVGLFGNTGKSSEIRNFILNNPVLLVGSTSKTTYSTGAAKVVGLAVGHVAGMCQSIGVRATNDNETYLQVADADTQYSTFNSILGELGDGVQSSVTGGGYGNGSGGSGNAFGASFDVDGMYDRLVAIDANKKSATPAWRLPEVDASKNDGITLQTHEKLPFTVSSESTYEGADASEVIGNTNIGYLVGNQNKVYNKKVEFGDKLIKPGGTNVTNWHFPDGSIPADDKVIPRWIYKISAKDVGSDTYNDYTGFSALTDAEYKSLSQDILELIPTSNGEVENFNSVRLSQTYNNAGVQIYPGTTSNGQWSPHGQISWMGNTYGEGYTMTDYEGDAVDVNGIKYTAEGYKIDENGYMYSADGYFTSSNWPVPGTVDEEGYLIDGTERFLDADGDPVKYGGYDLGHDGSGYYLIKKDGTPLEWDKGWGRQRIEPKQGETVPFFRFQGGIALPNCGIWFKPSQAGTIRFVMYAEKAGNGFTLIKGTRTNATRDNPFYVDYSQSGDDVLTEEVAKYTMPSWVLFYYEFEVKQEDIDAGNVEYWLMQYGSGGAYFVYMDLGASAAEDTSAVVPDLVSAVDFIYDGVEITQEDVADTDIKIGDFIVNASGTVARYDSSKTSIYFEDLTAALKIVYVRLHNESTDKHSGKTICLEKSDPKLDTDSEVHATYATYVCPTISGGSGTVSGGGGGGG
ncbi:MAG: hypothetical protein K2I17_03410, partial [Clostridia bacterium]|nr:hypothetical protein [Clostridia bacterium]